jgi:hypothetical protein
MNLSPEDNQLFYKLWRSVLAYTNRQKKLVANIETPEHVPQKPLQDLIKLRDAFYQDKNLLDQYLAKNPDGFSQAELLLVASWKHHFLPVVTDIAAQTSKLRGAETDVQNAAFGLLRAAATLSQVALDTPQNTDDHFKQLKSVKRALTRIENLLYEDLE